jgi:hypothetical protein
VRNTELGQRLEEIRKALLNLYGEKKAERDVQLTAARPAIKHGDWSVIERLQQLSDNFPDDTEVSALLSEALAAYAIHVDKVEGDRVGKDKFTISGSGHKIIIHTGQPTSTSDSSLKESDDLIEEKIRLDVASPEIVEVNQSFEIAVRISQPDSPPLSEADLTSVTSQSGIVYRSGDKAIVRYRVKVSAPDCDVHTGEHVFQLRSGQDSGIVFFQLTAKREGNISIVVTAYQESDILAAQTRIRLIATLKVQSGSPGHVGECLSAAREASSSQPRPPGKSSSKSRKIRIGEITITLPGCSAKGIIVALSVLFVMVAGLTYNYAVLIPARETAVALAATTTPTPTNTVSLPTSPTPTSTLTPTDTSTLSPTSTPTMTPTPTPDCRGIQVLYLELDLATGTSQNKEPDARGMITLTHDEIDSLAALSGRAILGDAGATDCCYWEGKTEVGDSWEPIGGADCRFSIGIPDQVTAIYLKFTVGEQIRLFTIKVG